MANSMLKWFTYLLLIDSVLGGEYPDDPYIKFRPSFARSLPVQILLTGVILTLVAVLFIHLMFTAQYHWPLAPVNYVLQLSGVTTLLISLIATIHVVLSATITASTRWPYMLDYIAVNVPPPLDSDIDTDMWSIAERATWLVMNASTSGLIQITHIQFLTLLYPSRLEGRLIFALLGPLAVVAAVMQLVPISSEVQINVVASAVRNVCNATLSLLFTAALFIWGLLVNRKTAWRTDGGTAAFGAGALTLAVVSTALNFLFVNKEDEFVWLPGLMWAVVLWQSFLGWWWWVGAGSGSVSGLASEEDVEDRLRRAAKRETRRREARERRKETKTKAKKVWQGVSGVFSSSSATQGSEHNFTTRSRPFSRKQRTTDDDEIPEDPPSPVHSVTPSVASTISVTSAISFTTLPRSLPRFIHEWYAFVRREHVAATRQQAAERIQRIQELERSRPRVGQSGSGSGWGLGSFGWRVGPGASSLDPRTRRGHGKGRRSRSLSMPRMGHREDSPQNDIELHERPSSRGGPSRDAHRDDSSLYTSSTDGNAPPRPDPEEPVASTSRASVIDDSRRGTLRISIPPSPPRIRRTTATSPSARHPKSATSPERPGSIWWWGPLSRWRLKDSTTYP